ncbi:MAG: hypothetical protein AAGJ87_16055, partial [Pseudomonadota bacterium]
GEDQTLENVAYTAEVTNVTLNCRYFADRPIDASVEIDFAFGRGPKATFSSVWSSPSNSTAREAS